jgi:hypothetical protein
MIEIGYSAHLFQVQWTARPALTMKDLRIDGRSKVIPSRFPYLHYRLQLIPLHIRWRGILSIASHTCGQASEPGNRHSRTLEQPFCHDASDVGARRIAAECRARDRHRKEQRVKPRVVEAFTDVTSRCEQYSRYAIGNGGQIFRNGSSLPLAHATLQNQDVLKI